MYDFFLSLGNFRGIIFPYVLQANGKFNIMTWGQISIYEEKVILIQPNTYIYSPFWLN